MVDFNEQMQYLDEINYELDFRDLYHFHQDIWITKEHADYIPLTEMGQDHIQNSINMIYDNGPTCCFGLGPIWLPKLINELKRRRVVE